MIAFALESCGARGEHLGERRCEFPIQRSSIMTLLWFPRVCKSQSGVENGSLKAMGSSSLNMTSPSE